MNLYPYVEDEIFGRTIDATTVTSQRGFDVKFYPLQKTKYLGGETMQSVYQVITVDFYGFIFINATVVAKNEESAKYKAGVYNQHDPEKVNVIVKNLGSVRVDEEEKKESFTN